MKRVVNKLTHQVDENKVPSELLDSSTEMDLMKRLKHIRRELDVILRVVTEQGNVIEQASELIATSRHLRASQDLHTAELAKQHIHKLEKRKKGIEALDAKAEHIFNDVSRFTRREITVCG
jgi:ABC-type Mn2+/Zn2+ transport system ATPase subunit